MTKRNLSLWLIGIAFLTGCEERQPSPQPEQHSPPPVQREPATPRVTPAPVPPESRPAEKPKVKQPLAIVPFRVLGKPSQPDSGTMLAEAMLPLFDKTHRLIDQTQLARFLDQSDLTLAGLSDATKSGKSKVKLEGVRYLIVGTLSYLPDGTLAVTARMTDWTTGQVVPGRVGRVTAPNWSSLQDMLGLLCGQLTGKETMDLFDEGMVQVQGNSLVVRVMAKGKNDLDRVQTARRMSRRAYAKYVTKHHAGPASKDRLLRRARDTEKLLDAELHGSVLLYTVSFDLPKGAGQ